jgi:hypothetical protein
MTVSGASVIFGGKVSRGKRERDKKKGKTFYTLHTSLFGATASYSAHPKISCLNCS